MQQKCALLYHSGFSGSENNVFVIPFYDIEELLNNRLAFVYGAQRKIQMFRHIFRFHALGQQLNNTTVVKIEVFCRRADVSEVLLNHRR